MPDAEAHGGKEVLDCGKDTEGTEYKNLSDMWSTELKGEDGRRSWYNVAEKYWHGQEASIDGVLGGYPETNGPDLRESKGFLELLRLNGELPAASPSAPSEGRKGLKVLDAGAGIGRVTSGLLLEHFDHVDLVEPNERLLEAARKELESDPRTGSFLASSLQDLDISGESYDVVWAQWVVLYLPDDDLMDFFKRCLAGLARPGLICVKENVVLDGGQWVVDKEDNSIARTDAQYKAIFQRCGLRIVHEMKQTCWPDNLIPVKMYALRPADASDPPTVKKRPASKGDS